VAEETSVEILVAALRPDDTVEVETENNAYVFVVKDPTTGAGTLAGGRFGKAHEAHVVGALPPAAPLLVGRLVTGARAAFLVMGVDHGGPGRMLTSVVRTLRLVRDAA
jgi:hypothetical protein